MYTFLNMALLRLRVSGFLKKCVANRESQFLIRRFLKQLVNRSSSFNRYLNRDVALPSRSVAFVAKMLSL